MLKNKKLLVVIGIVLILGYLFKINSKIQFKPKQFEKQIDRVYLQKNGFVVFQSKNSICKLNMNTDSLQQINLDLNKTVVVDILENGEIITLDKNTLSNSLGDSLSVEKLEQISSKDNYIIIKADGKYGVYDFRFEPIIPLKYSYIVKGEKLFLVKDSSGKIGYIDEKGEVKIPFTYDFAEVDSKGKMVVYKDNKIGVVDLDNKPLIPLQKESLLYISPNAIVKKENQFFLLTPDLKLKNLDISWAGFSNGKTFLYEKNSKFGVMDRDGKRITENIYDEIGQRNIELIITRKSGKYGLINQQGETVVSNIYDYIIPEGNYFFIAGNDGDESGDLFSTTGKKIFKEDRYESVKEISRYFLLVTDDKNYLIIDRDGKKKEKFEKIITLDKEWLIYMKKDKVYYVRID